jgi:hypothetical protein
LRRKAGKHQRCKRCYFDNLHGIPFGGWESQQRNTRYVDDMAILAMIFHLRPVVTHEGAAHVM